MTNFNNVNNRPADHCVASANVYANLYYPDDIPTFTLSPSSHAARSYDVYNLYGTIVASGSINASQTTLTLPYLPLGWYKMYFYRTATLGDPWRFSAGEVLFCVVRRNSNLISRATLGTARSTGDPFFTGVDFPVNGFIGIGPFRHQIRLDAGNNVNDRNGVKLDVPYENTWLAADSVRPLTQFCQFPDDIGLAPPQATLDMITASVQDIVTNTACRNFESQNEPNGAGISAANFVTRFNFFADTVHAASASAKVASPCTLSLVGNQYGWLDQVFGSAGVPGKIDVVSIHNYSAGYDLTGIRSAFDGLETLLIKYSMQNKPRINSEGISRFMANYGSFEPWLQARMAMLEYAISEQYKLPKENIYDFYGTSHGFWSFPSWWMNNESGEKHPGPVVALMRVWSEELFNKKFAAKLDFGTLYNNHIVGSRFDNPTTGTRMISQITDGITTNVKYVVRGSVSYLEVVDAWGNVVNSPVINGKIDVQATTLPTYIRLPVGIMAEPYGIDISEGRDVAVPQASLATSSSYKDLTTLAQKAASGTFHSFSSGVEERSTFIANDSEVAPSWWELDFSQPTRFDRVIVKTPFPWQEESGLLDFDLQYWNGAAWVVIGTETEQTRNKIWASYKAAGGCWIDSYYNRRNGFIFDLSSPITATKIRVYARSMTYGGSATTENNNGGGLDGGSGTGQGWSAAKLCLQEVSVVLKNDIGAGVSSGTNAVNGPARLTSLEPVVNLETNPKPVTDAANWTNTSGVGAGSVANVTNSDGPFGVKSIRRTWTASSTNNAGSGITRSGRYVTIPATVLGDKASAVLWVKVSKQQRMGASIFLWDGLGFNFGSAIVGTEVVCPANTWTKIVFPETQLVSGLTIFNLSVWSRSGLNFLQWANGDTLEIQGLLVGINEGDLTAVSPFDGDTVDTYLNNYSWDGAVDNSTSRRLQRI